MPNEQLAHLIGQVYDAAVNPGLWPTVLGEASRFVRGHTAALYWKDAAAKNGGVYHDDGGISPYYRQLYFDKYAKLDPTTTGHYLAPIEAPVAGADLIPHEEFVDTRVYQEWVRPQGLVDCVSAPLEKSATSVALFGVFRHERDGIIDDEARRRMRLITPHVRRAVLVSKTIELKTMEGAAFADASDGLAAGMFLVDAHGRIVHANAAGHAMLAARDMLDVAAGCLTAADSTIDCRLRDAFAGAGRGDEAFGIRGIAVPLTAHDGRRYVTHVLPLTSGVRRDAGRAYAAAAAVFVHKAALDTVAAPEAIAKRYKLTPSELRVLLAMVEVGGVRDVAEALGIAETTVKTHVGRLYAKTGGRRHADLVKIVAAFSNPLVS